MTDEHLMRLWADAHDGFSADLDRGLLRLGRYLGRRLQRRQIIDEAYGSTACATVQADTPMSATARAALAGVMACVATTALLVTVAALASTGTATTAALQAAMPAGSPIVSHVMLA